MSEQVCPVAEISAVKPHPNADRLEIAEILGWQVIVSKGTHHPGDRVLYVPPDSWVPDDKAEAWGVAPYLSNGRVRAIKLRGEPSFGFAVPLYPAFKSLGPDHPLRFLSADAETGENLAEAFGILKYIPPLKLQSGDTAAEGELFPRYTSIENLRHYPDAFEPNEWVHVTEKIHGTNSRVGIVAGEMMAGSHNTRRKEPEDKDYAKNTYWFPWSVPGVADLLHSLAQSGHKQVVLYGEVFGPVQKLHYGSPAQLQYRAFDLLIDGKFAGPTYLLFLLNTYGVEAVPVLYDGRFESLEFIKHLSEGSSNVPLADHYREGVVIRSEYETTDPRFGRRILKYVSDTYLTGGKDDDLADDRALAEVAS